jgi:hypothetical protein
LSRAAGFWAILLAFGARRPGAGIERRAQGCKVKQKNCERPGLAISPPPREVVWEGPTVWGLRAAFGDSGVVVSTSSVEIPVFSHPRSVVESRLLHGALSARPRMRAMMRCVPTSSPPWFCTNCFNTGGATRRDCRSEGGGTSAPHCDNPPAVTLCQKIGISHDCPLSLRLATMTVPSPLDVRAARTNCLRTPTPCPRLSPSSGCACTEREVRPDAAEKLHRKRHTGGRLNQCGQTDPVLSAVSRLM